MSDCQAGHEKTLTGFATMLAGSSFIYGPGMLESGMTFDPAQLVLDNEIIQMTRIFKRGVPVNDATTSIEEIMDVGPAGNFLERESTLKGFRSHSSPKFIDRRVRAAWVEAGSPEYYEKGREEARRILAEHDVAPLPDGVEDEIRAIVAKADEQYAGVTPTG